MVEVKVGVYVWPTTSGTILMALTVGWSNTPMNWMVNTPFCGARPVKVLSMAMSIPPVAATMSKFTSSVTPLMATSNILLPVVVQ